jgi:hypothetical protein
MQNHGELSSNRDFGLLAKLVNLPPLDGGSQSDCVGRKEQNTLKPHKRPSSGSAAARQPAPCCAATHLLQRSTDFFNKIDPKQSFAIAVSLVYATGGLSVRTLS